MIVENFTTNTKRFSELSPGQCFESSGCLWMKTDGTICNCVRLSDEMSAKHDDGVMVIEIKNAKVVFI